MTPKELYQKILAALAWDTRNKKNDLWWLPFHLSENGRDIIANDRNAHSLFYLLCTILPEEKWLMFFDSGNAFVMANEKNCNEKDVSLVLDTARSSHNWNIASCSLTLATPVEKRTCADILNALLKCLPRENSYFSTDGEKIFCRGENCAFMLSELVSQIDHENVSWQKEADVYFSITPKAKKQS